MELTDMQYPGRDAFKCTILTCVFKLYFTALFTLIKKECETEFIRKQNSTSPVKTCAIINWPLRYHAFGSYGMICVKFIEML